MINLDGKTASMSHIGKQAGFQINLEKDGQDSTSQYKTQNSIHQNKVDY